jgi:hypothetical protein
MIILIATGFTVPINSIQEIQERMNHVHARNNLTETNILSHPLELHSCPLGENLGNKSVCKPLSLGDIHVRPFD